MLEKSFDKKNVGKIFYKRKIFITKIYSNIDKCHIIFALLTPFDRTGRKTESNGNVCGIWFKIGSVARSHWTQVMWRFERIREKRYNHGFRTVGNSLTTWAVSASSVVRKIFAPFVYSVKSYWALKMEIPEGHFRHILLFYFRKGKNSAQGHRKLSGVYGERQCQNWFARFRSGNFEVKNEPRHGRSIVEKVDEIL